LPARGESRVALHDALWKSVTRLFAEFHSRYGNLKRVRGRLA